MLLPLLLAVVSAASGDVSVQTAVDTMYPDLSLLYCDLHQHPELALHEVNTSAKLAQRLKQLGFQVTSHVGGQGVVGILSNGPGPTVMLRTDMDALPVKEVAAVSCASHETAKDAAGVAVSVMHACGHDVHMTAWIGAATVLSKMKSRWHGTLMMVGQPAEEGGGGALSMLKDGLFTRFPKPDVALMIHDSPDYPAGTVALVSGFALANVDSVTITFHGRGGHGARPEKAVDPIVMAARAILSFQTLVSRENSPFDPAVVTVGSIHGGTKHNIIPDDVTLQLTVRSYKDEVRKHLLAGIERIAKAEALGANAPRPPDVTFQTADFATYNDPEVVATLKQALTTALGTDRVLAGDPVMGAEDFSEYRRAGAKASMIWVGAIEPKTFAAAQDAGTALPGLHSSGFEPDREPTIKTGTVAVVTAALAFLAPAPK